MKGVSFLGCLMALFVTVSANAVVFPVQHVGTDGAFEPTSNIQIDLNAAAVGPWADTPGAGSGVYDPEQWAVIFRFTEVNIPGNVKVTFINNHACAPVIWLVQGDVTINGEVNLNGMNGQEGSAALVPNVPGPGGFRGGRGNLANATGSAGFGPGGGDNWDAGEPAGGQFVSVYSNEGCFPLIGGSGGGGGIAYDSPRTGGAGGGAILIAAQNSININGANAIMAYGGTGNHHTKGGSGGMIRLLAETITGAGGLWARGQSGGEPGRIRIEAVTNEFTGGSSPGYSFGVAEATPRVLKDETTPVLTLRTLGGQTIPADPSSRLRFPADVQLDEAGEAVLVVDAVNVPPASTVTVRIVRADGMHEIVPLAMTGGDGSASTWEGSITVAGGFSAMQVHAKFN